MKTPVGKKVKTHILIFADAMGALTYNEAFQAADIWVPQDDVRVVGIELDIDFDFAGAISMAQGGCRGYSEVSRVGQFEQDGVLARVRMMIGSWVEVGGIAILGDMTDSMVVMFPDELGVDLDEGEPLYLNALAYNDCIDGGSRAFGTKAVIYYVER